MNFDLKNLGRTARTWLLVTSLLGSSAVMFGQQTSQDPAADNTKVNQRDQNSNEPTADQQKSNRSDLDITQQIRQSVMKDKSLSTYAHNVKIITQNGQVTLKGPVRSAEEKSAIEAKAAAIAGPDHVTDELEIKAKN